MAPRAYTETVEVAQMGCFIRYAVWILIAVCVGITIALLYAPALIAGIEAVLIILLCLLIACKI